MSDPGSQEIDKFICAIARARKSALLLDYDGTLAPFCIDRRHAKPYAGVTEILQRITNLGCTRLAIVTGRNADDIPPLLEIHPTPEVWGSHGMQRLHPDGRCEAVEISSVAANILEHGMLWLSYQGLDKFSEQKRGCIAVHWRGLDENFATELRARVLLGWLPLAQSDAVAVFEFDGGVELRITDHDKSDAVRAILREIGPDCPVAYLGDDLTDENAFRALDSRGLTILVRPEYRNTAAQVWLQPPSQLLHFLTRWCSACQPTSLAQTAS